MNHHCSLQVSCGSHWHYVVEIAWPLNRDARSRLRLARFSMRLHHRYRQQCRPACPFAGLAVYVAIKSALDSFIRGLANWVRKNCRCKADGIGVIPWNPLARGRPTRDWNAQSVRSETDEIGRAFTSELPRMPTDGWWRRLAELRRRGTCPEHRLR